MGSAPIAGPWSRGLIMRKAAFALSIVGVFPGIVLAVLYFPWALFSPSPELALLVAYCLATSVVCVVTAYLNSKASFKSSIIAPAVVSVLLGGFSDSFLAFFFSRPARKPISNPSADSAI